LSDKTRRRLSPETGRGDLIDAYSQHSDRSAAGPGVVAAIKHQREAWDGSGYPDQLTSGDIPLEARIVAVADAVDRWSEGAPPTPDALAKLQEAAGTRFDPPLVEEARRLLGLASAKRSRHCERGSSHLDYPIDR
jgi:HD-GYP domain-containing protein (c-di-GMP phosphodiesterase class II)